MRSNLGGKSRKRRSIGFSFAWNGLMEMIKSERNFRIHLIVTIIVITLGALVGLSHLEWMITTLVIGTVLVAETTNTAVEKLIDYLKPDIHPSAKVIKDIAAGAVLIAAITAFIIGCLLFIPKVYHLLL
ncbi:diacylglycerol kinase family protein [Virgibacillus necropolis]|uniref:Diacylglycerol kinase n=1 Tax=Virgibacillus necropolis TaxID=163877 RepID=A0A221MC38_9BACI|nr:diacylglycerol kinase family protein [Virgibacillus necropolis]ASN05197.1 diacylglycerol kinase [Virgibacillus necropolis]